MTDFIPGAPPGANSLDTLLDSWPSLSAEERVALFDNLGVARATDLFLALDTYAQAEHLLAVDPKARRGWSRMLAPDDAADVIQALPVESRAELLNALDSQTREQVQGLLAFAEDAAGGVMNPRYTVVRPGFTVGEAIAYLRAQGRSEAETAYYTYVIDTDARLVGVVSLRELLYAPPQRRVSEVMRTPVISVSPELDQEEVARVIARYDLLAVPVVDADGHMKGIVTVDDVLDVVQEEASEDIQKLGGQSALNAPYLDVGFGEMIKARAGWLTVLFVSEMLTATAMGYFENEIAQAVVLALFIPLIISSGGNTGSQASTLVVRALAVGDVQPRDWPRVLRREIKSGLVLGSILALLGFARIAFWPKRLELYGPHYLLVACAVALSLVGVVLWGTISGSMLPIVLRRVGFDPASASAPFVATLVDVTGLVIYFSVSALILRGTLL